jgi:hypothetical protein
MVASPGNERPIRAMPQSAQQHGVHQVSVSEYLSSSSTSQRDIQVISQNGRERDMPAPPKIRKVESFVW